MNKDFHLNWKAEDVAGDQAAQPVDSDMQDVNEESLLRALDRMGSRRQVENQKPSINPRRPSTEPRRRRAGAERDILVTRQSLARSNERGQSSIHLEEASASQDRLKLELKNEQHKNEALARELEFTRSQFKAAEAHLMHARLRVQELENTVQQKDARLVALRQEKEAAAKPKPTSRVTQMTLVPLDTHEPRIVKEVKQRGRKPQVDPLLNEPEPEPVRWWKD